MKRLDSVLCPKCVRPGGLRIRLEVIVDRGGPFHRRTVKRQVLAHIAPVMSCLLPGCRMRLVGRVEGEHVVFPDPHVVPAQGTREVTAEVTGGGNDGGEGT